MNADPVQDAIDELTDQDLAVLDALASGEGVESSEIGEDEP